jgi:hypothetical protein
MPIFFSLTMTISSETFSLNRSMKDMRSGFGNGRDVLAYLTTAAAPCDCGLAMPNLITDVLRQCAAESHW